MTTERYSAEQILNIVRADQERLFASWSAGRPEGWTTDQRTKDLICVGKWLSEELARVCANEDDRRTQQWYFNRWSRSQDNLFELAARTLNDVLDGKVEQHRIPHRRWG